VDKANLAPFSSRRAASGERALAGLLIDSDGNPLPNLAENLRYLDLSATTFPISPSSTVQRISSALFLSPTRLAPDRPWAFIEWCNRIDTVIGDRCYVTHSF
jgi:hypothetical protein